MTKNIPGITVVIVLLHTETGAIPVNSGVPHGGKVIIPDLAETGERKER